MAPFACFDYNEGMNLQEDHSLAPYCTYQIGGLADYFVEAKTMEEVQEALDWAIEGDLPYFVFSGGSNLLFDDAGFRGLVIRMRAQKIEVEGLSIHAEAGAMAAMLVKNALDHELTGLEAWNGLPGTVGGAIYGNAGCFGVETADVLESAEVYLPGEGVKTLPVDWFDYSYRSSRLKKTPGAVVLRGHFLLKKGEASKIAAQMQAVARLRIGKQPPGLSTGSFFKNPEGEKSAGWLIEQCGLKGTMVGKAKISEHHANFLVNTGAATSQDVLDLADLVATKVKDRFGIELQREVVFVPSESL